MSDVDMTPDSSPGMDEEGAASSPPDPSPDETTQNTHDPVPYERFAETQRERTQYKRQLEEAQASLDTFNELQQNPEFQQWALGDSLSGQPEAKAPEPETPQAPPSDPEDPEDWFRDNYTKPIEKELSDVKKQLSEVTGFVQTQQKVALRNKIETDLTNLEKNFPKQFERDRDWPLILQAVQQGRAKTIDDAFRLVSFDRETVTKTDAPVADVKGVARQGDAEISALRKQLASPALSNSDREEVVGKLAAAKLRKSGGFDVLG